MICMKERILFRIITGPENKRTVHVQRGKDMVLEKALKTEKSLIAGYLYNKLAEAEKDRILVGYKMELHRECPVSEAQLIEVTEYLFSHAMGKLAETRFPKKKIYCKLQQKEESVTVKFAYTSEMMSADQVIEMWDNHGKEAALYRLKKLSEDNEWKLLVTMKTVDDTHYLCIKVKLPCETNEGKHIFRTHKVDSL